MDKFYPKALPELGKYDDIVPIGVEIRQEVQKFYSAGLCPAGKIESWVLELLKEAGDITRWQYSSPVEQLCWYDSIVPVGVTLDAEDYPFQKVYPKYQDNREKRMDLERARGIVKEIERNCLPDF